jgi:hypothetical protein
VVQRSDITLNDALQRGLRARRGLFAAVVTGSPGRPGAHRDRLGDPEGLLRYRPHRELNFADQKEDEILQAVAYFANGRVPPA